MHRRCILHGLTQYSVHVSTDLIYALHVHCSYLKLINWLLLLLSPLTSPMRRVEPVFHGCEIQFHRDPARIAAVVRIANWKKIRLLFTTTDWLSRPTCSKAQSKISQNAFAMRILLTYTAYLQIYGLSENRKLPLMTFTVWTQFETLSCSDSTEPDCNSLQLAVLKWKTEISAGQIKLFN